MNAHQKVPFAKVAAKAGNALHFYYYASPMDDGRWQLQSSRLSLPTRHAGKHEAMAAARINCRKQWEEYGTPFGIRVRDSKGDWMDVLLHGGTDPSIGSSLA